MLEGITQVVLLLAWAEIATVGVPLLLTNSPWIYRRPRLGLTFWFAALFSSITALASSLFIAFSISVKIWLEPLEVNRTNLGLVIVISLAPWVLLALTGIVLALATRAIDAGLSSEVSDVTQLNQLGDDAGEYRGIRLREVSLEHPLLFSLGPTKSSDSACIVFSSGFKNKLSRDEFAASLDHEYAHLAQFHPLAKHVTSLVSLLSGKMIATKNLVAETNLLFELAADNYAAKRHTAKTTRAAILAVKQNNRSRDIEIRLASLKK